MKNLIFLGLLSITLNANGQKIFKHISQGDEKKVIKWILDGTEVNQKFSKENEEGDTRDLHVIQWAAWHNQKGILDLFIREKDMFDNYQEWISEALGANIHNCDIETFKKLLDAGASVNNLCNMCRQSPPIALALSYECDDIYDLLVENGAKLINEGSGFDVIHAAAAESSPEMLRDLVENSGLDVNQLAENEQINAAFYAGNIENLKYVIKMGAKYDIMDSEGRSILYYVDDLEMFTYLEGLLINQKDFTRAQLMNNADPLISTIISYDNKEFFDYYIENYSEYVSLNDIEGESPLFNLLHTEINTKYFLNELLKTYKTVTDKYGNVEFKEIKDEYGGNLKFYAKKMKRKELLEAIKEYEKKN
jgi:ankyrin repeat protein